MRSSSQRLIISLALVAELLSCSRDPNTRKQKYFQSGQRYFEKSKYQEAAVEFINAVKIDPNYAEAHYQLAETYLKLQKPDVAFQELARTLELQPQNYPARIELTNLLIVSHDLQQGQEQTNLLLKAWPNDAGVHSIYSSLLASQDNVPGAIEEMRKSIALDPGRWQSYLSLGLLQIRNHQPDGAEESFKKVIVLNPSATQPRLLLGNYYQSLKRYIEAENQFQKAVDMDRKNPEPRAALVRLYLAENKKSEAEDIARRAKQDFPSDSAGYRMLGDFYFTTGDLDRAVAEYASVTQEHPEDRQVKKDYIQLLLQQGRLTEADKLDTEILKVDPNDNDALIYRSQIQISSGRVNDATTALESVIKNDPSNSEAHYVLGVGFDKLGDLGSAEREWREALRLRPDMLDAVRALAGSAMRRGDMDALDQTSTQLISLQPASPEGYALRALSNINRKRFSGAEADIRKAIEISPQSAFGYVQLGNLKFAENQFENAVKAYQQALNLNQNSKDALRGLMNAYVAQKRVDQAIAAANAQIAKSPNNSGFFALLGTALFQNHRDLEGAEAAFKKSTELNKNDFDAWSNLSEVQAAQGNIEQAIATCQQSLKDNPRQASLHIMLGELYESKQDWNNAKASYQKALEIRPDDPHASNNLAYAILQTGGNADLALSLAQTAHRAAPDSPIVVDTLGWAYYQKGAYKYAIELFNQALTLGQKNGAPDNPRIHYHLGLAYKKTDQPGLAREELKRALKINPNSADAAEAKKEIAQLKSVAE